MEDRKKVSQDALLEVLNNHLAEYEQCEDCEVARPPYRLRSPREDGLNWSPFVQLRCHGKSTEACARVVPQLVGEIAARYNLVEE